MGRVADDALLEAVALVDYWSEGGGPVGVGVE